MPLLLASLPLLAMGMIVLLPVGSESISAAWKAVSFLTYVTAASMTALHIAHCIGLRKLTGLVCLSPFLGHVLASTRSTLQGLPSSAHSALPSEAARDVALLLIGFALTDQLLSHLRLPHWLRIRRPVLNGMVTATLVGCDALTSVPLLNTFRSVTGLEALGGIATAGARSTPVQLGTLLLVFAFTAFVIRQVMDVWEDLSARSFLRQLAMAAGVVALALLPLQAAVLQSAVAADGGPPSPSLPLLALGLTTFVLPRLVQAAQGLVARPVVLLTTVYRPFDSYASGEYILDYFSSRFTKGQGPFGFDSDPFSFPTHYIAQNLRAPARVLDFPSLDEFETELRRHPYSIVAIGFLSIGRNKVRRMCELIRRVAPKAKIVLGGYGVPTLDHPLEEDDNFDGLYDLLCHGDGVAFMRGILGEDVNEAVNINLPWQNIYPFGARFSPIQVSPMVAGFGCAFKCDFCATSAYFEGNHLFVATAEEMVAHAAQTFRRYPRTRSIPVFDEDFLAGEDRAHSLAELMPRCSEIPPGIAPFSIFATAEQISRFDPLELVKMGIRYIWIGVESRFARYAKLGQVDMAELFESLFDHGICVTGSFVIGFDCQTRENIEEDIDYFAGLGPTTTQIALLASPPGTALHRLVEKQGRLRLKSWEDANLEEELIDFRNFAPGEASHYRDLAYDRTYDRNGPSILRMWRVWLRGYLKFRDSADPVLRERADYLAWELKRTYPAIEASRRLGPTPEARRLAAEDLAMFRRELGDPNWIEECVALGLTAYISARDWRLRYLGNPARQPVPFRTTYEERRERYSIEVPSSCFRKSSTAARVSAGASC